MAISTDIIDLSAVDGMTGWGAGHKEIISAPMRGIQEDTQTLVTIRDKGVTAVLLAEQNAANDDAVAELMRFKPDFLSLKRNVFGGKYPFKIWDLIKGDLLHELFAFSCKTPKRKHGIPALRADFEKIAERLSGIIDLGQPVRIGVLHSAPGMQPANWHFDKSGEPTDKIRAVRNLCSNGVEIAFKGGFEKIGPGKFNVSSYGYSRTGLTIIEPLEEGEGALHRTPGTQETERFGYFIDGIRL